MKKISLLFLAILILSLHSAVFSFTVITKSGERVDGVWVSENGSTISIKDRSGVVRSFEKSNLDFKSMGAVSQFPKKSSEVTIPPEKTDVRPETTNPSVVPGAGNITEPSAPKAMTPQLPSGRLWSVQAILTNSYDTNINHNEENLDSVGLVYGAGVRWQSNLKEPALKLEYEAAKHSYSNTDQWDRISQNFETSYERHFSNRIGLELKGETSLKGSSEDREIGNEYTVEPQFKYKLSKNNRLEFYGAYRLKRYQDDPTRDSTNRFIGIIYERRLFSKQELAFEYRYEENNADGPKHDYYRRRYEVGYRIPFRKHDWVNFGFRYRQQNYHSRLVDINVENGPDLHFLRRDKRYNFGIDVAISLTEDLQLLPGYNFESRNSNDDSKDFTSHYPSLTLLYRWR